MEILIKASQLILSLSLLIVLHEFGHYLPARWFKTRVEKFYLFFDYKFSLFKKKIGETEWGIGWIPLGGYVKISGMIDESMDTEQMSQEPQPWEFRTKPAWQRLIIMIGGVVVNLILGIIIYMGVLFVWGEDYMTNDDLPNGFMVHEKFEELGFQQGDKVLTVDGEVPFDVMDINTMLLLRDYHNVKVEHLDGSVEEIKLGEDIEYYMFENDAIGAFTPRIYTVIDTMVAESKALAAGMKQGDSLVAVNGVETEFFDQFKKAMKPLKDTSVSIGFYRDGEFMEKTLKTDSNATLGFIRKPWQKFYPTQHKDYGFGESISGGFSLGMTTLSDYIAQLKFLFTSKGASSIGGFGTFGSLFAPTWDWHRFWMMTAFISIMLAFLNFLPIPALDGGHIMFLLYEMITGRKPGDKFLQYAQMVGFIILLSLVLFANGNDIYKAITGG